MFIMFLLSVLDVSIAPSLNIYYIVRLLILLFVPGYYLTLMLKKAMELRLDEILVIDVMISMAFSTLVSVYLSYPLNQITDTSVSLGLLIITLLSAILCLPNLLKNEEPRGKIQYIDVSKAELGLLVSFLIGCFLIIKAIPESYWRGWDPWLNAPVVRIILEYGFTPSELIGIHLGNIRISGFYYFLASVNAFTGLDLYTITRFGGPVLAGFASMITYLLVKRLEGFGAGLLASFFLCLNPFFVTRFSMTLRENFAFIFLLIILFFLVIDAQKKQKDLFYMFSTSLFLAVILISHSLVSLIAYSTICLKLFFSLFNDKRDYVIALILVFFFSFIISLPYIILIISFINLVIIKQVPNNVILLIPFTLTSILMLFMVYYKKLVKLDFFNKYNKPFFLIIVITLLLGAFYSIFFPRTFLILDYNPPITLDDFAISIIPLAILGFISLLWISVCNTIIFFSFIIVLVMNFPNLNMAFPLYRMNIYISWLLSYGAVKCLKIIYNSLANYNFSNFLNLKFMKLYKNKKINVSLIACVLILLIISPIINMDLQVISARKYAPNYHPDYVVSARKFIDLVKDNDIIVPQGRTNLLLYYVGINTNRIINNKTLLNELYSADTPQKFIQIIESEYPTTSRVYVFIINDFIGLPVAPTPSLNLLNTLGESKRLGRILFYNITLPGS